LLFTHEPLPRDPVPARDGRSLLAGVFAREHLPLDLELSRRPSRWLSWLFAPERLDHATLVFGSICESWGMD
jgi:hypothetical protein